MGPPPPEFDEATCATARTRVIAMTTGTIPRENFETIKDSLKHSLYALSGHLDWRRLLYSKCTLTEKTGYAPVCCRRLRSAGRHQTVRLGVGGRAFERGFVRAGAQQFRQRLFQC